MRSGNEPTYKKLVQGLWLEKNVPLIDVPDSKTLDERAAQRCASAPSVLSVPGPRVSALRPARFCISEALRGNASCFPIQGLLTGSVGDSMRGSCLGHRA